MTFELTTLPRTPELADFYRGGFLALWVAGLVVGYGLDWWPVSNVMRCVAFLGAAWYCVAPEIPVGRSFISEMRYAILVVIVVSEIFIGANDSCYTEFDGTKDRTYCSD